MSIKIMTRVWESGVGPASRRLVLLALADSANDEGVCWPSIATLARKAGIGRTTAEDAVRSLEADGLLVRNRRFNDSNVYRLVWENLAPVQDLVPVVTPPEIRGSPPESHGSPPPKSGGAPPEIPGTNRKGTQKENLKTSDANAPGDQLRLLPGLDPPILDEPAKKEPTLNQRAVILAQGHYERLGKMGNVPAWVKIIRKALEHNYQDAQVDIALQGIADRNLPLTEERLAITLRGGPRPASQLPAPVNGQRKIYQRGPNGRRGMELQES
jgi:hypothetical protein